MVCILKRHFGAPSRVSRARRLIAVLCAIVAGECAALAQQPPASAKPNLVLVIVDTLRADAVGIYGNRLKPTPEIDRLGERGIVFDNVVAQASWTLPSIGSLLTSQYPRSLGLYREENERLPDDAVMLSEVLKDNGYATFGITAKPNINSVYGFSQGFDQYIDSNVVFEWMPELDGKKRRSRSPLSFASEVFEKAMTFAKGAKGPTYLQVNLMEMHEVGKLINLTRPEYAHKFDGNPNSEYIGTAAQVSRDLGIFLDRVLALPGWSNTYVVVVSDHGEGLDSHPGVIYSNKHGNLLYQSVISVPWIIGGPALTTAPMHVREQTGLIDLAPTLIGLLHIDSIAQWVGSDVLRPSARGRQRSYFVETHFRAREKYGMYTHRWKYLENRDSVDGLPPAELQGRHTFEGGAKTNQIAAHPEIAERLASELAQWQKKFPPRKSTPLTGVPSVEALEQLRAIGYQ